MTQAYVTLQNLVESFVERKMQTPRDFDFLSLRIWEALHVQISPTTLKRFWGYLPQETPFTPRITTLNILSRLVGYRGWTEFLERMKDGCLVESGFTYDKFLYTRTLKRGSHLLLVWAPDRQVLIRLEGQDLFTVITSKNSKLSVGDTFICPCFVMDEPLHLHCLRHNGGAPTDYICGRKSGIRFELTKI